MPVVASSGDVASRLSMDALRRLNALVRRLRPHRNGDGQELAAAAEANIRAEIARLQRDPEDLDALADTIAALLALPSQQAFYAETGIRSSYGFWLELSQRLSAASLAPVRDLTRLRDVLHLVFDRPDDHRWVAAVSDAAWLELIGVFRRHKVGADETADVRAARDGALANLLEATRMLSYLLAGDGLDRELLRAEPALERYESPFMAQNIALMPLLERAAKGGAFPTPEEVRDVDVFLEQCTDSLDRVRRKTSETGISIRLTYLLARQRQLIDRLRLLLDFIAAEARSEKAIGLLKTLLKEEQAHDQLGEFISDNLSLLARNVTDHASRHGEHYIAEDHSAWLAMARSAAGGGVIIAMMAMLKVQTSLLHLPPLTEGIAFGLIYGLGFALIHLLGFVVATKQPAMTAASIAATLEDATPKRIDRLGELARDVIRTQFVAVVGNVGLAIPVACLIVFAWSFLFNAAPAPDKKLFGMIAEVHPLHSGALFFAGVAGIGLFLSGLVSGFFDNQARYHRLKERIAASPGLAWLGRERTRRLGDYLDAHYGAILGNLFFGMYLGLVGGVGSLTGLPIEIRHVAFSSANLGTAMTALGLDATLSLLPWAIIGVIGIALVNLAVSFALALYVAVKSRGLGWKQMPRLGRWLVRDFLDNPRTYFLPERKAEPH